LFPTLFFRIAYGELRERLAGNADREYLQLLKLACDESEERVSGILREMIEGGEAIRLDRVREMVNSQRGSSEVLAPRVEIKATPLASYDLLIGAREVPA
jgi:hypothetical protein